MKFVTLFAAILLSCWNYAQAQVQYTGVNLAGADFGTGNLPGIFNTDYTYPTHAEVDYFVAKGMNIFRLPFLWERLQNNQNEPFNSQELARIKDFVNYATSKQARVLLDPHNGARYYGEIIGIDGDLGALPVAAFQDFWTKLANEFKHNSQVIFGLMNEPN
jgi:endoglucanase